MRGLFTLASSLLTQSRRLTAVGNNIAGSNTPGYKKETISASAFGGVLLQRTGADPAILGTTAQMTVAEPLQVVLSEGTLEETGRALDFAIAGDGFFAVQRDGAVFYTRAGEFDIDAGGFLCLPGAGRIMGADGGLLQVPADNLELLRADGAGALYLGGQYLGRLAVYLPEPGGLVPAGGGLYAAGGAALMENPNVLWKTVERSNVNASEEMTAAISMQRQLQAVAQAVKMYDEMQAKANEIGRL